MRKIIWVVAGALVNSNNEVLLSQRPKGKHLEGLWEFPGGKIEANETPEEALCRELKEELGITILKQDLIPLTFTSFDYQDFHLVMLFFASRKWQGTPVGQEGQNIVFRKIDLLLKKTGDFPMPPADDVLLEALIKKTLPLRKKKGFSCFLIS